MKLESNLEFDFGSDSRMYFDLLSNEDFEFKTKSIDINIEFEDNKIKVGFITDSVIDFKIASNSVIKSLEIIDKTLKTI